MLQNIEKFLFIKFLIASYIRIIPLFSAVHIVSIIKY